jgi:hypothetical protein
MKYSILIVLFALFINSKKSQTKHHKKTTDKAIKSQDSKELSNHHI